jgi:hypothetical protein
MLDSLLFREGDSTECGGSQHWSPDLIHPYVAV